MESIEILALTLCGGFCLAAIMSMTLIVRNSNLQREIRRLKHE